MKNTLSKLRFGALALAASIAAVLPMTTYAAAVGRVYNALVLQVTEAKQSFALGSNTLTGLIPTLYAALDTVAREFVGFIPAVARDNQLARAAKGQQVTSFIAPPATAADVVPGVTAPNDGDQVFGAFNLTISKSRYVPVRWNGEEQLALNNGNGVGQQAMIVQQFAQAFRTLTNEMEADMAMTAYKAASRSTGTPGTAPFGVAGDLTDFSNPAQILDVNGAPIGDRAMIVSAPAMNNLRGKQSVLFKVNEAGTDDLLRRGSIGEAEGFRIGYAPAIKQVVKGTGASYVTSGTYAAGATAITLATGTGTVLQGDQVTFAGDPNVYGVNTGLSAPGTLVLNSPGLQQALANGVAMTVGNSFMPNIAFQRNGLILATRLPAVPVDINGVANDMADDRMAITDPFSGITFEVSLYRQYRQIKYEIALAWGTGATKSDFVALLRG
ncbi:P22 coat - protein 5 family protein [Xylophilus rhododendri]|uniref:P22 coat-protein 5 family protein n=1 Tax=Xylophilus rhododendri TaxID=2697032 RepID=A0A857J8R0_9BURK|nr:P22 phage major capsid protein family protein [Xylophilus rhododendri]QHJ00108.1 P22 coat - protein 5 family protein [Xylophilus rhododendri]